MELFRLADLRNSYWPWYLGMISFVCGVSTAKGDRSIMTDPLLYDVWGKNVTPRAVKAILCLRLDVDSNAVQ